MPYDIAGVTEETHLVFLLLGTSPDLVDRRRPNGKTRHQQARQVCSYLRAAHLCIDDTQIWAWQSSVPATVGGGARLLGVVMIMISWCSRH